MSLEYKILSSNSLINEEQLNELAKDEWELVEVVVVEYTYYFYFKRDKEK